MSSMEPFYERDGVTIYCGDNRDVLPHIEPVHAVVTDPPYGLSFMGKGWDHSVPGIEFWQAIGDAMLPGAHLLAFGGDRTMHRMMTAIEDAGLDIRTQLVWMFGQGFPKSHNVTKAAQSLLPAEVQCACGHRSTQTAPDSPAGYPNRHRSGDAQLPTAEGSGQDAAPSRDGVHAHSRGDLHTGDQAASVASTSPDADTDHSSSEDCQRPVSRQSLDCQSNDSIPFGTALNTLPVSQMEQRRTALHTPDKSSSVDDSASSSCSPSHSGYSHLPHCTTCGGVVVPEGLGTALKPAMELVCMARKPFKGTVVANVLQHGTGAINVDACRIPLHGERVARDFSKQKSTTGDQTYGRFPNRPTDGVWENTAGRWPANVLLDDEAAAMLDAQSGVSKSVKAYRGGSGWQALDYSGNPDQAAGLPTNSDGYSDTGGASRYFKVVAQDCLSTYNVEEQECALCGEESTEAGNTSAGKRTVSNESSSPTDGCGSKPTGLSQTGTKSTTSTTINSITSCPTCNVSPQNGTTTTISDCGKITETSTALNTDAASDVTNTSHSPSSSDARQEHIRATASHASANTCESGEPKTENTTTPTCASTESAITGSRFVYIPKASRRERNAGLDGMPERMPTHGKSGEPGGLQVSNARFPKANHHPTVKPLALMRYLIQMVVPPGGVLLDPFMGSGSTLVAAAELGFHAIGIELSEEYAEIAARRVDHALNERARRLPGLEVAD